MWKAIVSWQVNANPNISECGLGPALPLGLQQTRSSLTLALLRFLLLPGMPPLSPPTLKMTKVLEGTETKGGAKEKLWPSCATKIFSLLLPKLAWALGFLLCNGDSSGQCSCHLPILPKLARVIAGASQLVFFYVPPPVYSAHTARGVFWKSLCDHVTLVL